MWAENWGHFDHLNVLTCRTRQAGFPRRANGKQGREQEAKSEYI